VPGLARAKCPNTAVRSSHLRPPSVGLDVALPAYGSALRDAADGKP